MWPDDNGSWSPALWTDDTGTTGQNGPGVITNSVLGASTTNAGGEDKWSGFFQNLIGGVAKYAVQKDAAKSGLTPAIAPNGQPVYATAAPAPVVGNMNSTVLVLGGLVLVVGLVFAASSKG